MPPVVPGLDTMRLWEQNRAELKSVLDRPIHFGVSCLFAYDARGTTHIVSITQQVNGYVDEHSTTLRESISTKSIRDALSAMMPIANWQKDRETSQLTRDAREFVESLGSQTGSRATADRLLDEEVERIAPTFLDDLRAFLQGWGSLVEIRAREMMTYFTFEEHRYVAIRLEAGYRECEAVVQLIFRRKGSWKIVFVRVATADEDRRQVSALIEALGKGFGGLPH
jgi:hypothetical protein